MEKRAARRADPTPESVDAFIATLDDPLREAVEALRRIFLETDPSISEGIKWNVPSFRTSEYFATMNFRGRSGIGIVLHFGAKKTSISTSGVEIDDPMSQLEWLAKDRAIVKFRDLEDVLARRSAFEALIRDWIRHVG